MTDPTDEQLLAMYSDTDGDSSYDGWLSLYRAGVDEGRRQARVVAATVDHQWPEHVSDVNFTAANLDDILSAIDSLGEADRG